MKAETGEYAEKGSDELGVDGELMIDLETSGDVVWRGTRAQIEGEGILPQGAVWPTAFDISSWEEDGWGWRLGRDRPKGVRGPRKAFLEVDNWTLRRTPNGFGTWHLHALVLQKQRELEQAIFEASDDGRDRRTRQGARAYVARRDVRFQALLSRIAAVRQAL